MTLILSNDDVAKLLTMPDCIAVLEEAYVELAEGRGVSRTRSDCFTPTSREDALYSLKSMDGVIPKLGVGAVRINSDIVTWPKKGNNLRREKVPAAPGNRYVGLVLLFSTENGEPLAIFPGRRDAAHPRRRSQRARQSNIWRAKTPRRSASSVPAGRPARSSWRLARSGTSRRSAASAPMPRIAHAFSRQMSDTLGIEVIPVGAAGGGHQGADIVMCATNTVDPIFFEHWIEPGMHLSSIKRPEIEPKAVKRADRVVIHVNDAKPIHVLTKDLVVPEKAERPRLGSRRRHGLRQAADLARN